MTLFRSFSDRFSRFGSVNDFTRAGLAFLALFFVGVVFPEAAFAGKVSLGIQKALDNVINYITGPVATSVATIAMVGVLGGILVRSQRGESIGGLAAVGAALLVILNVENLITLIGGGSTGGALM